MSDVDDALNDYFAAVSEVNALTARLARVDGGPAPRDEERGLDPAELARALDEARRRRDERLETLATLSPRPVGA